MPVYRAPVEDMRFLLHDFLDLGKYSNLPGFADATPDLIDAILEARKAGASDEQIKPALELQRKAQWRLDYIAAENSMGFHAPQEAARILAEAADYARQGQIEALKLVQ